MTESFEYKGTWWLPSEPEKQIDGILKFDKENGGSLELIGCFDNNYLDEKSIFITLIVGITQKGYITLYKCYKSHFSITLYVGKPDVKYSIGYIFIGVHFLKPEDIVFNQINLKYNFLDDWINLSNVSMAMNNELNEFNIKIRKAKYEFLIGDDKLSVCFRGKINIPIRSFTEFSIKKDCFLSIDYKDIKSFEDVLLYIGKFGNFLRFCMLRDLNLVYLFGENVNYKNPNNIDENQNIEIFYKQRRKVVNKDSFLHIYCLLIFDWNDIGIIDKLKKWLEFSDEFDIISNLYFNTIYGNNSETVNEFLELIKIIENYHRKKYATTSNLLKRLKDLFSNYSYIKYLKIDEKIIKKIKDTRVYYTHYENDSKNKKFELVETLQSINLLKILIDCCILTELDYSNEEIASIVNGNQTYINYMIGYREF